MKIMPLPETGVKIAHKRGTFQQYIRISTNRKNKSKTKKIEKDVSIEEDVSREETDKISA
ncbi:hypothetical protein FTO70_00875 [Methanosarcina sp. KYL-1]|uniref:hypothetical protein n=1 Tax=Methanosarcina sp. KYL-1 TaxID=2602068 RepID=UPI002100A4CC|nr:hypothetical protein [Methanosarcina sp. KYL-1]MCQ1534272.1 hypothetical protein [Methanosarcina sp. KYL-1]